MTEGAVTRALRVLESVSPEPRKLGDIADAARVTRTNAHRILGVLGSAGYVQPVGGGSYKLAPRSAALAASLGLGAPQGVEQILAELREQAEATVHLALLSGPKVVYIAKLDGPGPVRMASSVGLHIPLHCTAIGKAVLAALPADKLAQLLGETGLSRRTRRTITAPEALTAELETVRDVGYAVDDEENEEGIRCLGMALVRDGTPVGGVSISTLTFATPRAALLDHRPALATVVKRLQPLIS